MPDEEKPKKGRVFGNKDLINLGMSAVDPEAAKLAEKLARGAPAWMRTPLAERITALLKSGLESYTDSKGPVIAALGEKLTDYLDFARDELYGTPGKKKGKEKVSSTTATWMDRFLVNAEKQLAEAKSVEEVEAVKKRLEQEFEARKLVVQLVEEATKAAREEAERVSPDDPTDAPDPIDWNAEWESIKSRAKSGWEKTKEAAETGWNKTGHAVEVTTRPLDSLSDRLERRARQKGRI